MTAATETVQETPSIPQKSAREEALEALEPTEIVEQPEPTDEVTTDATEEVTEQTDSQSTEESDPEKPNAEETSVSDEDIQQIFETEKTNVQKRINKLTAEKYSLKETNDALEKRIADLEAKLNQPKEEPADKPKAFTRDQLLNAKSVAYQKIEAGDTAEGMRILDEANSELLKLEIAAAKAEATKDLTKDQEFQKRENEIWQQYASLNPASDPDFDLNNKDSAIFRWTGKLYHQNPEKYNQYGEHRFVHAAMDARDYIVRARLQKEANNKIRSLEKQLGKQRAASQMDSGLPTGNSTTTSSEEAGDPIAERMGVFNQARKFA